MGIGNRIGRPWKAALLLAVGAAGGGAAIAVASVPDGNGEFHACVNVTTDAASGRLVPNVNNPGFTVIDPGAGQHCVAPDGTITNQTTMSWNQTGPQGIPGTPGTPGAPGAPGKSVTVAGGHTLTIGGQVITVGNVPSNTLTIVSPPARPSGNRLALNLNGMSLSLLSFGFAATSGGGSGGGGGAGKVGVHDLTITSQIDKSSTKLALYCAAGKHFPKATITLRKGSGKVQQFLTYTLTNAMISSYQSGGSGRNETPIESLSLNFTKLQIAYSK